MSKTGRGPSFAGLRPLSWLSLCYCSSFVNSPECVEVEFCEVRVDGVLGSLGLRGYRKSRCRQSARVTAGLGSSPWYT